MEIVTKELEEKLQAATNLEEAAQILTAEGFQVSAQELEAMLAQQTDENGEFDENALEHVSGGVAPIWRIIIRYLRPISPSNPIKNWKWRVLTK